MHSGTIQIYHKSKLVPGVEKMPWPAVFKYIEKFAIDLGGISGSLGMQEERVAFFTQDKKFAAGPIVCYESVYGEYVGEYVKKGANFLAIITNDGWWGDTPGYRQHLQYGALRAIETVEVLFVLQILESLLQSIKKGKLKIKLYGGKKQL
jgi:apolipoprotein N-acyltransferase